MLRFLVAELSLQINEVKLINENFHKFNIIAPFKISLKTFKKMFYSNGNDTFSISNNFDNSLNFLGENSIYLFYDTDCVFKIHKEIISNMEQDLCLKQDYWSKSSFLKIEQTLKKFKINRNCYKQKYTQSFSNIKKKFINANVDCEMVIQLQIINGNKYIKDNIISIIYPIYKIQPTVYNIIPTDYYGCQLNVGDKVLVLNDGRIGVIHSIVGDSIVKLSYNGDIMDIASNLLTKIYTNLIAFTNLIALAHTEYAFSYISAQDVVEQINDNLVGAGFHLTWTPNDSSPNNNPFNGTLSFVITDQSMPMYNAIIIKHFDSYYDEDALEPYGITDDEPNWNGIFEHIESRGGEIVGLSGPMEMEVDGENIKFKIILVGGNTAQ